MSSTLCVKKFYIHHYRLSQLWLFSKLPPLNHFWKSQLSIPNYRPVSSLSFLSKVLERIILLQLSDHLQANNLLYSYQSAYWAGDSIEIAILSIVNNLLSAQGDNKLLLLSLLDLSCTPHPYLSLSTAGVSWTDTSLSIYIYTHTHDRCFVNRYS